MHVTSKCPLRVSIAGGSTDSPIFINKYGFGSVITFTPNIYTYCSLFKDINGFNNISKKYFIQYSKKETVKNIDKIKNQLIKICFSKLNIPPSKITLSSEIFSSGSGLASSSSLLLNILNCCLEFSDKPNPPIENLAFEIEKEINPLVGFQDIYGCKYGGLKQLFFYKNGEKHIEYLNPNIFNKFNMFLVQTPLARSSSDILRTIDYSKSQLLLKDVKNLKIAIQKEDEQLFIDFFKIAWKNKINTSKKILNDTLLELLNKILDYNDSILCYRLCGAGGGGYFLIITEKNKEIRLPKNIPFIKINIENLGLQKNIF